jgi:hypothetical protein
LPVLVAAMHRAAGARLVGGGRFRLYSGLGMAWLPDDRDGIKFPPGIS